MDNGSSAPSVSARFYGYRGIAIACLIFAATLTINLAAYRSTAYLALASLPVIGTYAFPFFNWKSKLPEDRSGRLRMMAIAAGIDTYRIGTFKSRLPKAYANGFSATTIILLSEGLLGFEPALVEAIFAHELGHHHHRHPLKQSVLASLAVLGVFFCSSYLAGFLGGSAWTFAGWVILLSAIGIPIGFVYVRACEKEADEYAADLIHNRLELGRALEKIRACYEADGIGSPPNSLRWLRTHPSLDERIQRYSA